MVTFNNLLSWSGTNLDTAGDALVAASHKYEQVNTDLQKDRLGDGLSEKTSRQKPRHDESSPTTPRTSGPVWRRPATTSRTPQTP